MTSHLPDPVLEQHALALAEEASARQKKAAEAFLVGFPHLPLSHDVEALCVLLAEEFRAGINLTLETYGLKEPSPSAYFDGNGKTGPV